MCMFVVRGGEGVRVVNRDRNVHSLNTLNIIYMLLYIFMEAQIYIHLTYMNTHATRPHTHICIYMYVCVCRCVYVCEYNHTYLHPSSTLDVVCL